ncbi:hypothetical protein BU23DRAFT_322609 [Bimuria novae-zelandiae CBS 107.79]|uniref:Uncharacterized protein n=1 Tax=Bimuria novae-zelandiae CBS 107.79 TaxID=1447943 RepID=A0A6A5VN84_9PLEO|nr:hypothetical protein BU23DRAFT_322609 [Bimuria novae-zelandiae CBS 107.79]
MSSNHFLHTGACTYMTTVYHKFNDPDDPEGIPPTPKPIGQGDLWREEESENDVAGEESDDVPTNSTGADGVREALAPVGSFPSSMLPTVELDNGQSSMFGSEIHELALRKEDLFLGHPDRERLLGQVEGMLVAKYMSERNVGVEEAFRLCRVEIPPALVAELKRCAVDAHSQLDEEAEDGSVAGEEEDPWADLRGVGAGTGDVDDKDAVVAASVTYEIGGEQTSESPAAASKLTLHGEPAAVKDEGSEPEEENEGEQAKLENGAPGMLGDIQPRKGVLICDSQVLGKPTGLGHHPSSPVLCRTVRLTCRIGKWRST